MAGNKSSIEAGRGHVTLTADDSVLKSVVEASQRRMEALGRAFVTTGAMIAGAGAAITAPFMRGLGVASEWADEMTRAMRATGIGFNELDELMDGLRVNGDELVSAAARVSHAMHEAFTEPAGEAAQRLRALGLSVEQLQGMTLDQRMMTLADAISRVGDSGERLNAMRTFFRNTGLNIEGGAAGMRARAGAADRAEGTPSEADLRAVQEYNRAMKEMSLATAGFWRSLGITAAPVMQTLIQTATNVIIKIREWTEANRPLLQTILTIGLFATTAGSGLITLGGILIGTSFAVKLITSAIQDLGITWAVESAAKLAKWAVVTAATVAYGVAVSVVKGIFTVFSMSSAVGWAAIAAATKVAAFAMAAYGVTVGLVKTAFAAFFGASVLFWSAVFSGSMAAKIGTIAYAVSVGIANAAIAVYNTLTTLSGLSTAGLALATLGAKAAMWLYNVAVGAAAVGTTIATAGVNLLVAALGALILIAPLAMAAPLIPLAILAAATLSTAGTFDNMGMRAGRAARGTADAWVSAFGEIKNVGLVTFDVLQSALRRGDWETAWQTIKVFGLTAWNELAGAIKLTWISVFTEIKVFFIRFWTDVTAIALRGLASVVQSAADIAPEMFGGAALLREQARGLELDARIAEAGGRRRAGEAREQAGADADRVRFDRAMERFRLHQELQQLQEGERAMVGMDLAMQFFGMFGGAPMMPAPGGVMGGKFSSMGTFSNTALAGFLGATSGMESKEDQRAREQKARDEKQIDVMARMLAIMQRGGILRMG